MQGFWASVFPVVLVVAGLITASSVNALVAPKQALTSYFGADATVSPEGAWVIVRSWGATVFACGGLMIAAAFLPQLQLATVLAVGFEKLVFAVLLLATGRPGLTRFGRLAAGFDLGVVVIFLVWLFTR